MHSRPAGPRGQDIQDILIYSWWFIILYDLELEYTCVYITKVTTMLLIITCFTKPSDIIFSEM